MQVRERSTTEPTDVACAARFAGSPPSSASRSAASSPSSSPGPVDASLAALVGGAITGVILGAVQSWGLRTRRIRPHDQWIAATALGLTVGLGVGAAAVGYGTSMRRPRRPGRDLRARRRSRAGDRCCAPARRRRVRLGPALERAVGARLGDHHRASASTSRASTRCSAPAARSSSPLATTALPLVLARAADRSAS